MNKQNITEEQKQMIKEIVGKIYRDGLAENMTYQDIRINELYELFSSLLQKERAEGKREGIEEAIKDLPKELGFDDYDKHVHTYATEGSGKCGICGLSWRTTTIYGYYNTAIVQVKKLLRKKLKSQSVEKSNSLQEKLEIDDFKFDKKGNSIP